MIESPYYDDYDEIDRLYDEYVFDEHVDTYAFKYT